MPPGIIFIALWVIGLLGGYLALRWLLWRITGSNRTLGDTMDSYGRGFGEYNWQRWNERQLGEAEKRKSKEHGGLPRQVTRPRHHGYSSASEGLQATESADTDPLSLSELLHRDMPDDEQQRTQHD